MASVVWGRVVVGCFALCISASALAQTVPPSARPGRERQQFTVPPAPQARPGGPAIRLPSTTAPPGAATIMLRLSSVRIKGATVYATAQLAPLYRPMIGHRISLAAIYDLAKRITAKYGADGYVLSRAVVPPQTLNPSGATVTLRVVEGYIDKVEWPAALKRYRDFFSDYAARITGERPINIHTLERYLLLANDLPGLTFTTVLKPSPRATGASVLVVKVKQKRYDVLGRIDNRGSTARGPIEGLVSATLSNPWHRHGAFTATAAATSQVKELAYFAATYRQVLDSEGLTGFVDGSYGFGRPGTPTLETLDYKTKSTIIEAGLSYPIIRSRERNLTVSGLVFMSESDSDSNLPGALVTRDRLRGFRLKADAEIADSLNGINQFNITFSQGINGLGSSENGSATASRASGRVDFSKIEFSASRLQPLVANLSAYLAAYGQYAFTPLLVPEQCGYGGRAFGRAFDPSELLGDRCVEGLGELRYDLPSANVKLPTVQLYGFSDYGKVYNIAPAAFTPTSVDGASAGAGLRIGWRDKITADLSAAKAIEGPRNDWRFFFVLTARR